MVGITFVIDIYYTYFIYSRVFYPKTLEKKVAMKSNIRYSYLAL